MPLDLSVIGTRTLRSLITAFVCVASALSAYACGGNAVEPAERGAHECTVEGATKQVDCNGCICQNGNWMCTLLGCATGGAGSGGAGGPGSGGAGGATPGAPCAVEKETRPASDGCNSCYCSNGSWACSFAWCGSGGSGSGTGGAGTGGPGPSCTPGASRPADDGCNTCSCIDGSWLCTLRLCECQPGDAKWDDCNRCSCYEGFWGCTEINCATSDGGAGVERRCGAWLGEACPLGEYCAFIEGQLCGAFMDGGVSPLNATAACKPRPQGCTKLYDPVCGCDRKTYGNSCMAATAGVGVISNGSCPVE